MTREKLKLILNEERILPERGFGQNFLCDDDICVKIAQLATASGGTRILEIGPGLGAITEKIASSGYDLTCVEIDKRLSEYLIKRSGINARIITGDYLKLKDYDAGSFDTVVSNLPYYVMTDIMKKIFSECINARRLVFMVEEDALDRITAVAGSRKYGPLSVLCSLYGGFRKEFIVTGSSFIPAPNTTSCVISFTKDKNSITADLVKFIERCFINRRKKLVNNCPELKGMLERFDIPEDIRAECLSPDSFLKLYNAIIL